MTFFNHNFRVQAFLITIFGSRRALTLLAIEMILYLHAHIQSSVYHHWKFQVYICYSLKGVLPTKYLSENRQNDYISKPEVTSSIKKFAIRFTSSSIRSTSFIKINWLSKLDKCLSVTIYYINTKNNWKTTNILYSWTRVYNSCLSCMRNGHPRVYRNTSDKTNYT